MPPLQKSSFSIYINAPPEFVFDYLADVRNMGEWSPGADKIELESPDDDGSGMRFRLSWEAGVGRGTIHEVVITERQRPSHLVFVVRDEYFEDITQEFSLRLLEGGTIVQRRVSTSMSLTHALLARLLIGPLVQPLYENSLRLLKQTVEARARQQKRRLP
jgi:carbon monoxide dehydrogenase subunit G